METKDKRSEPRTSVSTTTVTARPVPDSEPTRAETLTAYFPGNSEIASLFNQLIEKVGKLVGSV